MGSSVIPLQRFVNLAQLDVNIWKINNVFWHLTNKQYSRPTTHSLISEDYALEVLF